MPTESSFRVAPAFSLNSNFLMYQLYYFKHTIISSPMRVCQELLRALRVPVPEEILDEEQELYGAINKITSSTSGGSSRTFDLVNKKGCAYSVIGS